MKNFLIFFVLCFVLFLNGEPIQIARIQYSGGGDWYNDPEIIPNLANFINNELENDAVSVNQEILKLSDKKIFNFPFLFLTGHGKIKFSEAETKNIRQHLLNGGFLYIDDDYGMDKYVRRELSAVFPEFDLIEISSNHEIFHSYFDFPKGLPKIHKHDDKKPRAFGLFTEKGRLVLLYSFESNISDGWASEHTHNDPYEVRLEALKMGMNIFFYQFVGK